MTTIALLFSFASPLHHYISLIILLILFLFLFLFSPPFSPHFLFSNSFSSNSSSLLFPSPLYNSPHIVILHLECSIFSHLFEGLTTEESTIPNNLRVPNYGSSAAKVREMVKNGKDTFNKKFFNSKFFCFPLLIFRAFWCAQKIFNRQGNALVYKYQF